MTTATQSTRLRAELRAEDVLVGIDSREQAPWSVVPLACIETTWQTGDYGLIHAPNVLRIERKSLDDYLACLGGDRERFFRQMERMLAFQCRVLVVEATWPALSLGGWRSKITPASVVGSTLGLIEMGIQVVMAGDRMQAEDFAKRLLFICAKRRWREAREFVEGMRDMEGVE